MAAIAACSSESGNRTGDPDATVNLPPADAGFGDVGFGDSGEHADAACVPACSGKTCGPDGCGGECGTCGDRELCDDTAGTCIAQLCPPAEPFGTMVGQHLPAVTFKDCDGSEHSLQDMCEAKASYFFIYAGW